MEQDQVLRISITDLNHSGEGVGRKDGRVVFVPYAAPSDEALVRIVEERRGFARAELLSLERESPNRVLPPCPVYLQCGGCQLQHISYDAQLAYKKRRVEQALRRIGKFDGVLVKDCLAAPSTFHYRNKAKFSYSSRGGGADVPDFVSGFYGRRTHDVVDLNECLIQSDTNNEVFQALNAIIARGGVRVWQGGAAKCAGAGGRAAAGGAIKHLVARCGREGAQAIAVLVTAEGRLRGIERVADELMLAVPKLAGVVEEVEPAKGRGSGGRDEESACGGHRDDGEGVQGSGARPLRDDAPRVVRGVGFFRDRVLGLEFTVNAASFFQVNAEGMEVLYEEVLQAADLSGGEVALDAYCGVGTITLALARQCRHVYGVEESPSAVADARVNATHNRVTNCSFVAGRVEDVLTAKILPRHVHTVVLDPPRAGCDPRALHALSLLGPGRIVYVSCDPETLARDLRILADSGYEVASVQPVDMFPQTSHVETVVLLLAG
ncbi:MAG: 23S rRNA (uracil(1939)-C(5))-methyltransferase RlmD [Firmicutes bacterium]|jgi:23S rRNA (uracil1939-C5)-methyltransferase|nr:23S rRNA (uracil(1939)-C(5))-methyltransferase RlmD [Bacillota bacterium]MDH7495914.1 23S rRNA (uracil(1939)-C(5))-methyltransferase RlmD [Bacillota bacterium]